MENCHCFAQHDKTPVLNVCLLLSVRYNQCGSSRSCLQETFLARRSSLNVASLFYMWRDVFFQIFMKCFILNDVQSSQASPVSGWGVSAGNSAEISFFFGTKIVYLKQEGKKKNPHFPPLPLKSLLLRPACVLKGALRKG